MKKSFLDKRAGHNKVGRLQAARRGRAQPKHRTREGVHDLDPADHDRPDAVRELRVRGVGGF